MPTQSEDTLGKLFGHTYVLDTSVLVFNPNAVETFGDNSIVIPIVVLEELDKMKRTMDGIGASAREAIRNLDNYRKAGSLRTGVATQSGGRVRIGCMYNARFSDLPMGLEKTPDNHIILNAYVLNNEKRAGKNGKPKSDVIVVSKDVNLRIKAEACGLRAEDYRNDVQIAAISDLYPGVTEVMLGNGFDPTECFRQGFISEETLSEFVKGAMPELFPNEGCILRYPHSNGGKEKMHKALSVYNKADGLFRLLKYPQGADRNSGNDQPDHVCVGPRNDEQALALDHLMNQHIPMVSLVGKAGTGKTLIALLAAVRQLQDGLYDQILVYRPNIEMGEKLGYLPGDIGEKFEPWKVPIYDNLPLVLASRKGEKDKTKAEMARFIDSGRLVIDPINFIRGRTFHGKFVIVDEAQNLRPADVKTIATRMGKNSKLVLAGDPAQIDNSIVDAISNGLTRTAHKLRCEELFAHVTLVKSERSVLAELAAERL